MGINEQLLIEIQRNNQLLTAAVTLLAQEYELRPGGNDRRIELVLATSGLGYQDIATVLNKKPDAVRMWLARNRNNEKTI